MTKRQNIALICVIAVIAVVLFAVGGYFIDTYASSDGERRSDGFVYSVSGNTATISAYEGEDTTLTIPARIAGRRVALIEEGFLDNTSVTEVIFSEDITMIELEEGVFEDNTKLTYVSLPASLSEIPERAFSDCTGLVRVKLPSSLEKIGASAFEGCSNLETSGASGEKQFVLPDTLTEVGEDAFKDCGDLTSVTIGTGLKDIPDGMFDNCDSINSLTFAEGSTVEKIGEGAFRDNNLGRTTLPDSLKYIGAYSFENNDNSSFTSITIPAGVVTVSAYAFSGCSRLSTVEFAVRDDGTRDLEAVGEGAFMNCVRLATVKPSEGSYNTLPDSVTEIAKLTFYGCDRLSGFTIGKQVTSVGDGAFAGGVASEVTSGIDNKFLSEASGYQFVQLTSYTYFGTNANSSPVNRTHYILTDATGEVVYAYIGAFDPDTCNNMPDMTSYNQSRYTSFYFLMDAAIESDIVELRPYALAGVKGMINIPTTVETIGAFCFKDCEPDGDFLNIFIANSDCVIDEETFDETGISDNQSIQILVSDTNCALVDAIQAAIDADNRNWISDPVQGNAVR